MIPCSRIAFLLRSRLVINQIYSKRSSVKFIHQNVIHKNSIQQIEQNTNENKIYTLNERKQNAKKEDEAMRLLTHKFKHCFEITDIEAKKIITQQSNLLKLPLEGITMNIELLFDQNVTSKSIIENVWVLGMSEKNLVEKLHLIRRMDPGDINDFLPLIRVTKPKLFQTIKNASKERNVVPEGNRIYYFAKRLDVEPSLVSKYFSTHMFMFEISYEMLVANLNIMLEYKITSMSILRDLWAFKYLPSSIRVRLERCRKAGKRNLKPWIIRCPEEVLDRTLTLSQESKSLLGDNTIVEYLSERLGYDIPTIELIVKKHTLVLNIRITKVKDVLDYLLEEEKFQPFEIANNVRILCHSLETTKKRIGELKKHGCRPSSLVIICKSQSEYKKFLRNWIEKRDAMGAKGKF
ncbi:CLUMA_CG014464, isoform A [Clunio marinus]|uniref:CLUMA_CG014464, isoform A n=1 Tax=Clunio marinus TaxID=568069 RepID=A0A1J1INZ3_9DIPT|nr:CLUMA_CG014464, isoform A [Clunio marinus]